MRRGLRGIFFFVFGGLGLAMAGVGCGSARGRGAVEHPGPAPAVSGAAVYVGQWRGITSQGLAIGFTVDSAGVTAMDVAWNLSSCNWASNVVFQEAASIEHGELSTQINVGPGHVSTDVSIIFSSAASAAGTLKFAAASVPDAPGCMGVGTATFSVLKT